MATPIPAKIKGKKIDPISIINLLFLMKNTSAYRDKTQIWRDLHTNVCINVVREFFLPKYKKDS